MARWFRALIARFGLLGYAAAAVALVLRACWLQRRRTLPALGIVATLLPIALHLRSRPQVLTVTFLNVGKGDVMVAVKQPIERDLLKVAHHSLTSSSSVEFLQAATPAIAVTSVEPNNEHGYRSPEMRQRLDSIGARIFRTVRDGYISIVSDGSKFHISLSLE